LGDIETFPFLNPPQPDPNRSIDPAIYSGIHRSILSGLLAHIANRREKNIYCATGNREAMVFPGSNLFDKNVSKQKDPKQKQPAREEKTFQPKWIVSGEIVETSRLFARTNARIDPLWIVQLGEHICKFTYHAPHWSAQQGRVLVTEKVLLGGLEIHNRLVPFAKVNPKEATEIFIRSALVEEPVSAPHRFLAENQKLREKVETWQTRLRSTALPNVDEALYRFYAKRLQNVSSIHDLNRFVREEGQGDRNFLCATEADLIGDRDLKLDETSFPESVEIHGRQIPLQYAYAPGEEHDGVTAHVPITLVQHLRPGALEWAVPGWREEQVRNLLKALPKSLRVPLMPLEPKVNEICRNLKPDTDSLLQSLSSYIQKNYKVPVTPDAWPLDALPSHLKPRVQVTGAENKPLATSRDLGSLKSKLRDAEQKVETSNWDAAAVKFERYDVETWDFGDLPAQIEIPSQSGLPLLAYPGLQVEDGDVSLRLFRNRDQAVQSSQSGLNRLGEFALGKELAWLQKDLRSLNSVKDLYITLGSGDELIESAFDGIRQFLFSHDNIYPLTRADFDQLVATARERLPGFLHTYTTLATEILRRRQEILLTKKQYPGMLQDLNRLVPPRFLSVIPWSRLQHFSRYLKALQIRAERWGTNPVKDQEKARQILPYQQRLVVLSDRKDLSSDQLAAREEFRWLIEELKVSLYAQELGTSTPVSPRRLDRFIEEHRL
ncbi:MAG TPA: DUF3418 domain-containing protein, partial [Candidatus Kapabacteria bacterium]|nr:DUF3418 domain-containing protein [Candidatus Kapabacteria bacterium]